MIPVISVLSGSKHDSGDFSNVSYVPFMHGGRCCFCEQAVWWIYF